MIPLDRLYPYYVDRTLPSPNHGARKTAGVSMIVLHATADNGSEAGAESWMRNPDAQASAHLHIRRDGSITRLVDDERRAWHAGRSSWPGVADINSASLGWEIANRNDGREPYTDAQYRAVAALLQHYLPQGIDRKNVVSHAQVAPGRKTDPRGWDWTKMWALVDAGVLPEIPSAPEPLDVEIPLTPMPDVREPLFSPPEIPEAPRPEPRPDLYPMEEMMQTTIVQAKPWWQSKTILLGAAEMAVGAAELIATTPVLQGSEIAAIAATVAGGLTILLRLVTKKPVAASQKPVAVDG